MTTKRRIGVFVCHCGGNISDYVNVQGVVDAVADEPGVTIARTHTFTCSDASQQDMINDIKEYKLDGLVVASCSPKLHMFTFRGMAERAGLNPYQYVQVNLREQCSWAHTDDEKGATEKGIAMVRAGIAKAVLSKPLTAMRIQTEPRVLVIGAGLAGLRAALSCADMGLTVYLIERESEAGGAVRRWGPMAPEGQTGRDIATGLVERVRAHERIMLYTEAELIEKSGTIGDFQLKINVRESEEIALHVGAIIVTTGYDHYKPAEGELGYGLPCVLTMPEFRDWIAEHDDLVYNGRKVKNMAFIYCVGSRQQPSDTCPNPNQYCSRYCCTATTHAGAILGESHPELNQYHLYRDIRTYGHNELVYEKARNNGALFLRYDEQAPPEVSQEDDHLLVRVKDQLTGGEEIEIPVEMLVLATGMVPRENEKLLNLLKLPISIDGFLNEIHIKLRPVETVIDGVFIAGASQSPKTMAEAVGSSLCAVSKAGGLLKKGYVDLEPLIAQVYNDKCIWCDECLKACPYGAIEKIVCGDKEIAHVIPSLCKGEGACVPVCPHDAIDVEGYTDEQITAMIDACSREVTV